MSKVAKLVWVTVGTRVVIDEDATDSEAYELALPGLQRNLLENGLDNLQDVFEDTEFPYDPETDEL